MSGFIAGGIVSGPTEWYDEKSGSLVATGTLALTLPTPPGPRTDAALERLRRLGFKIGLLLEDGQRVEEFGASGVLAEESRAIAEDLTQVFGAKTGQRWVGLAFKAPPPPEFVSPNVARYALRLRLTGVRQLPQLIMAPSRYGNAESFAESYLSAVWILNRPR